MKNILNQKVSDRLANTIIVISTGVVLLLGFFYYQQTQKVNELELRLERNHHMQERFITTMKNEDMLEDFLNLEEFTEEEKETIRSFAEEVEEESEEDSEEENENNEEEAEQEN
ncbi:MAG: hypothetical protein ACQEP3_01510 [Patescibacteria group bacterium]